jgi:hypothetical protein
MQSPFTQATSPGRVIMSVFVLSRRVWPNECRLKSVLLVSQYIARFYAGLAGDRQSCDLSVNAMHLQLRRRIRLLFLRQLSEWTGCQNMPYVAILPSGAKSLKSSGQSKAERGSAASHLSLVELHYLNVEFRGVHIHRVPPPLKSYFDHCSKGVHTPSEDPSSLASWGAQCICPL